MRIRAVLLSLTVLGLLFSGPAPAEAHRAFPEIIPLPNGFQPEGISTGKGTTFYVGSIPTGAIFRGDFRTGEGTILVPPSDRSAIGLEADQQGRLFVAGGSLGTAFVYRARTGELLATYQLAAGAAFVNDVVVTKEAAWFTDSFNPVLYRVPLGRGGRLPDQDDVESVPVTGDYVHQPDTFNLNGIDATPSGRTLVVVQSATGSLFTVDPDTGVARRIDLGGDAVTAGDGILLDGRRLFVVQNVENQIAVVDLSRRLTTGRVVDHLTHPAFDVPTTIAEFGRALYAVNARFGVTDPDAHYEVVRVRKP
jgi:sugar lactone lactonase YvrE